MILQRPICLLLSLFLLVTICDYGSAFAQSRATKPPGIRTAGNVIDINILPAPPPITLLLDKTGNYNVILSDVATISGPNYDPASTTISPQSFNRSTLGNQSVLITAYDKYSPLAASFSEPGNMAVDNMGNIFVIDEGTNDIRKIAPSGRVTTVAGNGSAAHIDGKGTMAAFDGAIGIAADNAGNIYVTEATDNSIRKIDAAGNVTTIAGNGTHNSTDGIGLAAGFDDPVSVTVDGSGDLYVCDAGSNKVRMITPQGVVRTVATAIPAQDYGTATFATSIMLDKSGNIFVLQANYIVKITPGGQVLNFAGDATSSADVDGPGATAKFRDPCSMTIDGAGNLYVVEQSLTIREVSPAGVVSTIINQMVDPRSCNNVVSDPAGNLYLATADAPFIKEKPLNGAVVLFGGNGISASIDNTRGTNQLAVQVTVEDPEGGPSVNVSVPEQVICANQQVTFTASLNNLPANSAYQWMINGLNVSNTNSSAFTPAQLQNNDEVSCYATPPGTGAATPVVSNQIKMTVNQVVIPSVFIGAAKGGGAMCAGAPETSYEATTSNDGASFQWMLNGNPVGGNSNFYINSLLKNGDQLYCIITLPAGECYAPLTATSNLIQINFPQQVIPAITITQQTTSPCEGSPVTFQASVSYGGIAALPYNPTYQWIVNNITVGDNQPNYTGIINNGDAVSCAVTGDYACAAPVSSNTITAQLNPSPTVNFSSTSTTINVGDKITLVPIITGTILSYSWLPSVGLNNAGIANPVASPVITTQYNLLVTSTDGCQASGSFTLRVLTPIIVPNTFTPNGDGINDQWEIKGLNNYLDCIVQVFTRYGTLVYRSVGYGTAWDGTYNGRPLSSGTYYYIIDPKNNRKQIAGALNIVK